MAHRFLQQGLALRAGRTRSAALACLLALGGSVALRAAADSDISENRVKAAVVAKIAAFVTWPPQVMASRRTIELCVGAPNRFGGDLAALVEGQKVDGRDLVVRVVSAPQEIDGCQILFVPGRVGPAGHSLLARAQSRPVLTIGDYPEFLDDGGIVNLRVVDGRVRFDLDLASARRAGLQISSQLARLALSVRGASS